MQPSDDHVPAAAPQPEATTEQWRFVAPAGLLWEELDDQYIVFNPLSDEVHRLNPIAAAVLAELEQNPLDLTQLCLRLGALFDQPQGPVLRDRVTTALAHFDELGLIFPTPPSNRPS